MDRAEEIEKAKRAFAAAGERIYNKGKGLTMAEGGQGAEGAYAQTYQNLVRLGVAQQIKKKYRRR